MNLSRVGENRKWKDIGKIEIYEQEEQKRNKGKKRKTRYQNEKKVKDVIMISMRIEIVED